MGWLMVRKTAQVREKQKTIYMQDVLDNPVLKFQKKYVYKFNNRNHNIANYWFAHDRLDTVNKYHNIADH